MFNSKKKYIYFKKSQHGGEFDINDKNINGYNISDYDSTVFSLNDYASTYGEISRTGLKDMLKGIQTNGKVFYDLGSGLGKSVLWSVVDHGMTGKGIEISKERHDNALKLLEQVPKNHRQLINLYNDDMFNHNIKDGNIIFISNLCFPQKINDKLVDKIVIELNPGSLVFS